MNLKIILFSLFLFFISCRNKQSIDSSILIPIDSKNVIVTNQTDESGKKQGLWEEDDTVNHRISKEFYYKDDLLDSSYLIYKTKSSDTLILGYYKSGRKHGEWKYWNEKSNQLDKIEVYENNILKETKKF